MKLVWHWSQESRPNPSKHPSQSSLATAVTVKGQRLKSHNQHWDCLADFFFWRSIQLIFQLFLRYLWKERSASEIAPDLRWSGMPIGSKDSSQVQPGPSEIIEIASESFGSVKITCQIWRHGAISRFRGKKGFLKVRMHLKAHEKRHQNYHIYYMQIYEINPFGDYDSAWQLVLPVQQ